jgi:hypothetical protein
MSDSETEIPKPRGRPFEKGQSGNPAGKPCGTRNRSTRMAEALMADASEALAQTFIAQALGGSLPALLLAIKRLVPPCRERPLQFNLPPLESPADVPRAINCILAGLAEGELTENETKTLVALVEMHLKAQDEIETDRRLTALEEKLAELQSENEEEKSKSERGKP